MSEVGKAYLGYQLSNANKLEQVEKARQKYLRAIRARDLQNNLSAKSKREE